ncbi:hypothetical protein [Spiroplasma sp. AdecLV25b]|uniref:hypothetical protein n=1 Tax=Spiroplasma sp. AdecLV25b TaxID=3027162 RepID=UPI0027E08CDB|nr:hypothetical protein [Spiroplasma sp. AdecLV25b]
MKNKKKIIPLIASVTLLAGPVLLVTACDNERDMSNLPNGKIPDDYKNRILFDFLGVNFTKTVGEQFKDAYASGLDLILNDVEGIIAQQKFYDFFHNTLSPTVYTEDTLDSDGNVIQEGTANQAFDNIKDDLGLSLLTQAYLQGIKSCTSLDETTNFTNNLVLFQTDSWHRGGTGSLDYSKDKDGFYAKDNADTGLKNDPNDVFANTNLYKDFGTVTKNEAFMKQLADIAKHPDDNTTNVLLPLQQNTQNYIGDAGVNPDTLPKALDTSVTDYQRNLKRFQWSLRFRYEQYYKYMILPKLNEKLFTMSYLLSNLFIPNQKGPNKEPIIETTTNNAYIGQLQNINDYKSSNYRSIWNFQTNKTNAIDIETNWNTSNWQNITNNGGRELNSSFFNKLKNGTSDSINQIDNLFGANGYTATAAGQAAKPVADATTAGWVTIKDGTHYELTNDTIANFTYTTPIYFLNVLQNLDFSCILNDKNKKTWIPKTTGLIQDWNNSSNPSKDTDFSKYIRGAAASSDITQDQKFGIFWQMLYFLADSDANKDNAANNFKLAAQSLFPTYIPKDNIYEKGFWDKIKQYY